MANLKSKHCLVRARPGCHGPHSPRLRGENPAPSRFTAAVSDLHLLPRPTPVSKDPASSSLAQSVMSMVSSQSQHSQISTDTVSSMSGSYVAPGTEEEGEALPSPRATSRTPSDEEEVSGGHGMALAALALQAHPKQLDPGSAREITKPPRCPWEGSFRKQGAPSLSQRHPRVCSLVWHHFCPEDVVWACCQASWGGELVVSAP